MSWIPAAITAGGALLGGLLGEKDSPKYPDPKILPKTVSGAVVQDYNILYNAQAIENLYNLGETLGGISASDRAWFEDIYKPFQERMVKMNESILPAVEKTSAEALESITRSLVSGEAISKVMEARAKEGLSQGTKDAFAEFQEQLKNLPSESERVGQALTNVESSFSATGKELVRDYQSRGQTVTQASKRDLAMNKAKAKAGAAGLAAERSRAENLAAAEKGAGLSLQMDQAEMNMQAAAASVVSQFAGLAQSGLAAAQRGLVEIDPITGLETQKLQAGIGTSLAGQQFGTRGVTDTIEHTQKGIKSAVVTSGAGGQGNTVGGVGASPDPNLNNADFKPMTGGGVGGFQPVEGGPLDNSGGATDRTMATGIGVGKTVDFYGSKFHVQDDGKIINLQDGGYLDSSLQGGQKSKYDNEKFINLLMERARTSKSKSSITTNPVEPKKKRPSAGEGGLGR